MLDFTKSVKVQHDCITRPCESPKKDQVNLRDAPNFNKLFNILNGLKPNIDLNWRQTMTSNK